MHNGKQETKRLVIGMLAHVDAGKTTLAEGLLYAAGALRRAGRVDHGDAFLDNHEIERARGITIFSKQAILEAPGASITLLDTPGHVDFSTETERTLCVLDYALLIVSGGIQAHTRTLWRLLENHGVPVFLFVNKTDLPGPDRPQMLKLLREAFSEGCVDFTDAKADIAENAALCAESLMEAYLARGSLSAQEIAQGIARRQIFPVYFGSALRHEGVEALLHGLCAYSCGRAYGADFGARIFKITHAEGMRLSWMKITGGRLRAKDILSNRRAAMDESAVWEEKADQIRLYSGTRFRAVQEAEAGMVCAVCGLQKTRAGEGLGFEMDERPPMLEPALRYSLYFPEGVNLHEAFEQLQSLQEEDPQLRLVWDGAKRQIQARLMGDVQREVLQSLIETRFGYKVRFGPASILYKETILEPCEGIGHYEPLRHFAHVELLLEPGPPGSGLRFASACSEDVLARNWQRLILTHLGERQHRGVLTGAPITDMRITLLYGKAHLKHTEGGDFRQAVYRAVRQGLMRAKSQLLEPCYDFRLELPAQSLGRAMHDLERMDAQWDPPQSFGADRVRLTGSAPVSAIGAYARELAAYTRGEGQLSLAPGGYRPCAKQAEIVESIGYDPEADAEHSPDSIYCSHGAGYTVKWNTVCRYADSALPQDTTQNPKPRKAAPKDEEALLTAIYERTYGPVRDRRFPLRRQSTPIVHDSPSMLEAMEEKENYLLVDGYNILFAWEDLRAMARESIALARETLIQLMVNYRSMRPCNLIVVFDAYKVTGGVEKVETTGGIYIVYTREAETADAYIERISALLKEKKGTVRVATSDGLEQLIVLGQGALRLSARLFREEVDAACGELRHLLARIQEQNKGRYGIWQIYRKDS